MVLKPTLSIFTGSETMGTIFSEQNQINNKITEFTTPFSDTTGNTIVNWKGKTRLIVVQGAQDGSTFAGADNNARLLNFVNTIEEWVNDSVGFSIQTSRVYTNSLGTEYNVIMVDWTWNRSFSDQNRLIWTMIMRQV